jgi:hypothetical protein
VVTALPRRIGRPPRDPAETVRTAIWYDRVRNWSGKTELQLEIEFDELDRAGRGLHKSSRWNKYRFGRASPGRDLLLRVETKYPGTLVPYDHPIWRLTTSETLSAGELRSLLALLPEPVANLLLDPSARERSPFWARSESDHRQVIVNALALARSWNIGHIGVLSGLLLLVHDAVNRQLEQQHFDCHVAIAWRAARAYAASPLRDKVFAWRLESYLLGRWLSTEYRRTDLREVVEEIRNLRHGPAAPWVPRQGRLALAKFNAGLQAQAQLEARGFWVCQRLEALAANRLGDLGER